VSLFLYLRLRVVHVTHLYDLVLKHDVFIVGCQFVEGKQGGDSKEGTLMSTGGGFFRCERLPLFDKGGHSTPAEIKPTINTHP
jgi:hypothetical protein